jgi:3-hydroxybutyryl-CoA dehydrogenase
MEIRAVAVAGPVTMGAGIAGVFARAGYARPADADAAMTLGCGYPRGPLELLDQAGPAAAMTVLAAMHQAYGDPAFAPPPMLADYAATGLRFRGADPQ